MKILVTNPRHPVSSVLCGLLLDCGYEVVVVGHGPSIGFIPYTQSPSFEFIGNKPTPEQFEGIDVVIHVNLGTSLLYEIPLEVPTILARLKDFKPSIKNGITLEFGLPFGYSPTTHSHGLVENYVWQAIHNKNIRVSQSNQKLSLIHNLDVAHSIIYFLQRYTTFPANIFKIGDKENEITKTKLAELIQKYTECKIHHINDNTSVSLEDKYDNPEDLCLKYSVEDGVKELLKIIPLL